MQSYTDGETSYYNDPDVAGIIWGFRYVATGDDRTRPDHAALDGVTLPKNDTFWLKYTPPWDHYCRCDRVPVTYDEIASGAEKIKKAPYYPTGGF
jgi:SPP1 gp7 family putative phage head morphogenesis protein